MRVGGEQAQIADFRHVPTHCKFLMMMPQWDFLDFLAEHARRLPSFHLVMQAEARTLVAENGRVAGLVARTPDGELEMRAALVVGADGRHSTIRAQAGLALAGLRRADGRAVDARLARGGRSARPVRPDRRRPHAGDDRARRLLAVRAADRQGLVRRRARPRHRGAARVPAGAVALAGRAREGAGRLGPGQAAVGDRRPPARVGEAGPAVHRRRGARHVADRRRRHQPGRAGRRRRGAPAGRAAARARSSTWRRCSACSAGASGRCAWCSACRSRCRTG